MVCVPDASTIRLIPWAVDPTAQVIHDCVHFDGTPVAISPRRVLRQRARTLQGQGLEAGHRAGTRVLSGRHEQGPGSAAATADRPDGPSGDRPSGVLDRSGQRIRSAVRRHLRVLRHSGAGSRHADSRSRRRADGNQLHARRSAQTRRQRVPVQAHGARGRAASQDVCDVHGQADGRRTGLGDAHASEPRRRGKRPQPVHRPGRQAHSTLRRLYRRPAEIHAGADADFRAVHQLVSPPVALHGRADQRAVGLRQPHGGFPDSAFGAGCAPHRKPHSGRGLQSVSGDCRDARRRLPRHDAKPAADRAAASATATNCPINCRAISKRA